MQSDSGAWRPWSDFPPPPNEPWAITRLWEHASTAMKMADLADQSTRKGRLKRESETKRAYAILAEIRSLGYASGLAKPTHYSPDPRRKNGFLNSRTGKGLGSNPTGSAPGLSPN